MEVLKLLESKNRCLQKFLKSLQQDESKKQAAAEQAKNPKPQVLDGSPAMRPVKLLIEWFSMS